MGDDDTWQIKTSAETLLDKFAGRALENIQGLIDVCGYEAERWDEEAVGHFCYKIAEAMLAEKKRREQEK